MAKKYEKEYDSVTVSTEATDLTKITLTVPDGFEHNDVFKACREIEISAMSLGAKF
jgi:hypothetical protein